MIELRKTAEAQALGIARLFGGCTADILAQSAAACAMAMQPRLVIVCFFAAGHRAVPMLAWPRPAGHIKPQRSCTLLGLREIQNVARN